MTDDGRFGDDRTINAGEGGDVHIPILLRRFRTRFSPTMADDTGPSIAASGSEDGDHVAAVLAVKIMKLETAINAMKTALPTITDPGERLDTTTEIGEAEAERALCKARHDQIDAGGSFNEPPQAEEDALLAALDAVDKSLSLTAGIGALLSAVHKVVAAFPGRDT